MKRLFVLAGVATLASSAMSQYLYSNQSSNANVAALNAVSTSRNGTAAPAGGRWSEAQANGAGAQPESNTVAGFTGSLSSTAPPAFRLADDFTITGPAWQITDFHTYGYMTGSAMAAAPISGGTLNIWNGAPNLTTSSIIGSATFLNMDNDIIVESSGATANVYRIFNSNSPPPGSAPGTTRIIREVNWSANIVLGPGTYWVDFQYVPSPVTGSIFVPGTTHQDVRGVAGANAMQLVTTGWTPLIDAGNPAAAADVAQDLPFLITGRVVPEPGTMIALGAGVAALLARRRRK